MRRPRRATLFVYLMCLAAVGALLPRTYTQWIAVPVQLVAYIREPLRRLTSATVTSTVGGSSAEVEERSSLERLVLHQQMLLAQRDELLATISGIRQGFPDGEGSVWVARVLAFDGQPSGGSLLIGRGSNHGIERGMWVAAGQRHDATEMPDRLYRGWLVGRVSSVQPMTSRVQLTTATSFACAVVAAKELADGMIQVEPQPMELRGAGRGQMVIRQATRNYSTDGIDLILGQAGPDLPSPMLIGRITGASGRNDSPLHFDLTVEPVGDYRLLETVYVIVADG